MGSNISSAPRFSPRRLGHANLFVTDLDRSMLFYNRVCGLEEVRREPGISAGFLTNGNTHHDIGLMQIGAGERTGIDGYTQVVESRMKHAGLNHLGWELDNEKQLVEAYNRAVAAGIKIHRTTDHQLSHSVYVFDPEGNLNEFYADAMKDWRSIFNPDREDLISGHWDPLATEPSTEPKYDPDPDLRRVEGAAFHSLRITHAVLVAKNLARLRQFYEDVGGLTPVFESPDGSFICLKGTSARYDLVLFAEREGLAPGLQRVAFEIGEADLESAAGMLKSLGFETEHRIETESKRSIFVKDPDGLGIEFYTPGTRAGEIQIGETVDADQQLYLV